MFGASRRDRVADRHQHDPERVQPPQADPVDGRPGREAAEREPEPARRDQDAEADVAAVQRDLRQHDLGHVDRGVARA